MMDTMILASATERFHPAGMLCLAMIPVLIVIIMAYATGPYGGSCICAILFIFACLLTTDNSPGKGPDSLSGRNMFYCNSSQTKWLNQKDFILDAPGSYYRIKDGPTVSALDDEVYYIPAKEMYMKDGYHYMKSTDERPVDDDYYLVHEVIDNMNVSREYGGWGIPTWIYHPGCMIWGFGLAGLPSIAIGGFVLTKIGG